MYKPSYFKPSEFKCNGVIVFDNMNDKLLMLLDKLRLRINKAIVITSSYRTKEHNAKVGGYSNSQHLKGLAVDIRCKNSNYRYLVIKEALRLGFVGIGVGSNFIHLDIRDKREVMWTY